MSGSRGCENTVNMFEDSVGASPESSDETAPFPF